jgi:transaldolase
VGSVASVFVSRWDSAIADRVPADLKGRLGIAVAQRTYKAYRDLLASDRWLRLLNVGARSQRLLWASTGTKDPKASDVLYVKSLAAPHSVNALAAQLQRDGAASFVASWKELLACLVDKSQTLKKAG